MNRLAIVSMVSMSLLGGVAHASETTINKAVNSCIAETLSYQRDGLSEKDRHVLEARVKQECRTIVLRECSNGASPLCQHFSGMTLSDSEQGYSEVTMRTSFSH